MNQFNKSGFMLIEVMMAVAILGIASIPLLTLQANIIENVWEQRGYLDHITKLKNLFFNPELQNITSSSYAHERVYESKEAQDFIVLKYECLPISSRSELSENFPDLHLVRSSGTWSGMDRDYEENLISFIYIAPIEEPKKLEEPKK